ncbi:hypothetical protein Z043_117198 [Scleropages formosus]|uniref:Uncharacterized protein n=1 Tax=Scleropages formosus TaxID=113540 RepID=A0A0P7UA27_SCLFO|nr:hypothetical protein Z043_117198 [Scleropages formosus]
MERVFRQPLRVSGTIQLMVWSRFVQRLPWAAAQCGGRTNPCTALSVCSVWPYESHLHTLYLCCW